MRCVAFCTADNYQMPQLVGFFKNNGYAIKQYSRKVLHIVYPAAKKADVFIFNYGCVVFWGMKTNLEQEFLNTIKPFAVNPLQNMERDGFVSKHGKVTEMLTHKTFNVDIIILESDSVQIKLAISYGLAQSIQLEALESSINKAVDEHSTFPLQLAQKGRLYLSQRELNRRMGKIFLARSSINLNSGYLEDPDFFWEHTRLERYYKMCKGFLDIPSRVSTLNQKLDVLHELLVILTGQSQDRRSNILELIIILLIVMEILMKFF